MSAGIPLERVQGALALRTYNTLMKEGYRTVQAVRAATDEELLSLRNFGPGALADARDLLGYTPSLVAQQLRELADLLELKG